MTNKVLSFALGFILTLGMFSQKPQRIAYIDMEYILENIPDYQNAVNQLNQKAEKWKQNVNQLQNEVDQMQLNLSNEKALLTKNLVDEREQDIAIKVEDLRKLQNKYFGTNGELFTLRQQLTKPIQDQVFNAIQEIAVNRQYDFVFDKSSDLIMLYFNDKYDISDMIVKSITRSEKQKDIQEKRNELNVESKELTEEQIQRQEENDQKKADQQTKKEEMLNKIELQKAERAKLREEQLKAIEEARQKKIQEKEEARKKLEEKKAAEKKAREEKQQNEGH